MSPSSSSLYIISSDAGAHIGQVANTVVTGDGFISSFSKFERANCKTNFAIGLYFT